MGRLVIVEGNISAGKTTLVKQLGDLLGYRAFLEPAETNPYLTRFYEDPGTWALPMQLWLLEQRHVAYMAAVRHVLACPDGGGAILDRSIWSDWVFAERNRQDGNITEEGFAQYMARRETLLEGLPVPHCTIYLRVSPEQCHERIHQVRKREAEVAGEGIPLLYLQGLDQCYGMLISGLTERGSAVIVHDWSNFGSADTVAAKVAATPHGGWDSLAAAADVVV